MTPLRPQLVLIAVTLLWGSTFVVTKDVLPNCPTLLYLAVRFTLGAVVILWLTRRRPRTPGLLGDSLLLGLLQSGGLLLQVFGQSYTTASKSAFLTALAVPLTPVCGRLLRGDRPRALQLVAMAI